MIEEEREIPYYPAAALAGASDYQKTRCRLDFRRPRGGAGFPTVVWFHGGGLTEGDKHYVPLDPGIAQAAVRYRFLQPDGSVTGDDCVADAAAAVAWALDNVAARGGDPRKVFVSGMSAGAWLTMLVGMDPSRLAPWGHRPADLAGLVPISGQASAHFAVRQFAGDAAPRFLPRVDRLAPLSFCAADLPPLLALCGEPPWEIPGRNEENRLLVASCAALGHPAARFIELPACDHGRAERAAMPYLEMFVKGEMLPGLVIPGARP